jgi:DNA repair protein RecO (recombination protein O)
MKTAVPIEGIVLTAKPFFEADKRLVLLTREQGKLQVLVKNALKSKTTPLGAVDATAHMGCMLQKGQQFWYAREIRLISGFGGLRRDLATLQASAYVLDVADKITDDNQPHPTLFALMLAALSALNDGRAPANVLPKFHAYLLRHEGLLETDQTTLTFAQFKPRFEQYTGKGLRLPRGVA